jgi:hypothetical protein
MQEHDPFTFALNEIRAHDAGRRRWPVGERIRRLDELVATEAEEIAWGRRHLTLVYGQIATTDEEQALDDAVCIILDTIAGRWNRLTGVPGSYLTVTIDGEGAPQLIHTLQAQLAAMTPRHWALTDTAIVEVPQ